MLKLKHWSFFKLEGNMDGTGLSLCVRSTRRAVSDVIPKVQHMIGVSFNGGSYAIVVVGHNGSKRHPCSAYLPVGKDWLVPKCGRATVYELPEMEKPADKDWYRKTARQIAVKVFADAVIMWEHSPKMSQTTFSWSFVWDTRQRRGTARRNLT